MTVIISSLDNDVLKIPVGGTFNAKGKLYVERAMDVEFLALVQDPGAWINVFGCRAMGKSSLIIRHWNAIESSGFTVAFVDVAADIGHGGEKESSFEWVCRLAEAIAASLAVDPSQLLEQMGQLSPDTLAAKSLEFLFSQALPTICPKPIFLVLDEYDYILESKHCKDLVIGFRRIKTRQAQDPDSPLARLSICLVGWRPITQLLEEKEDSDLPATAPFAHLLEIKDFESNADTVNTLLRAFPRHSQPTPEAIERVLWYSGGQPLVTMELLDKVLLEQCLTPTEVTEMVSKLVIASDDSRAMGLFHAINNRIATWGQKGVAVANTYVALLRESREAHFSAGADDLMLAGIVRRQNTELKIKGELFRQCFDQAWADRMLTRIAGSEQRFRGGRSANKRILLINTGGTLGMVERDGQVIAPENEYEYKRYFQALDSIATIKLDQSLFHPRDSINVFPDQWIAIARHIYQHRDNFEGVVVAHGTDTMADTASAVAFALGPHLNFPVVFTGAQTTPDVAHGDAHANLYRACEVAKQEIHEVVICFGNFVYRAVRAQKVDDRRFDGFESPTFPPLAEITGEITVRRELLRKLPQRHKEIELRAHFATGVLLIPQFPGLEPEPYLHLLRQDLVNGVILQTRGAGNVASADPYSFIPFVSEAFQRGVPVIVTSQYPPDPDTHTRYAPAQAPLAVGAINAGNMTLGAAAAKFRWVLADVLSRKNWRTMSPGKKRDLVSRLMVKKAIVGEF